MPIRCLKVESKGGMPGHRAEWLQYLIMGVLLELKKQTRDLKHS